MEKLFQLLLIILLLFTSIAYTPLVLANINLSNIEVFDIRDNQAKLKWDTFNEPTKAVVYFGDNPNNLNRYVNYGIYDYQHETILTGLQKDKTYYYKIVAFNRAQERTESFLQTFSTKGMKDTQAPEFKEKKVLQTTKDAVAISWTTNEKTRAQIYYGTAIDDLNKTARYGGYDEEHELFIYKLKPDTDYYLKIVAEDKSKNKKTQTLSFKTGHYLTKDSDLVIYNIQPLSFDQKMIFTNKAILKWRTNLVAKSRIYYGTQSNKYKYKLDVNNKAADLMHSVTLTDLEPNTTYFYQIKAYDSLYRKKTETRELTFTTRPLSLPLLSSTPVPSVVVPQCQGYCDSDSDRLSDGYELEIGTDPFKWDTDGDGYDDGNEMRHGYDPLIPGSTPETRLQASRYFRPKLSDKIEEDKSHELRELLSYYLGEIKVSAKNWQVLTDSYIYGGYPVQAISQAIRFGGRTVHPTIPWSAWKNSPQYLEFIDK